MMLIRAEPVGLALAIARGRPEPCARVSGAAKRALVLRLRACVVIPLRGSYSANLAEAPPGFFEN